MRLKHVKGASEKIENSKYIIKNETAHKGKYHQLFNNNNPIHIEIGMGKGDFIIEKAKQYPNTNFIGIERYDSVIVRAVEKLEQEELSNLKLIRMNANDIEEVFKNEIAKIYLNFSDPWPKDRHEKRRLTSLNYLKKYDNIFHNEKNITIKTDNRKLFEFSLETLVNYGYKIKEISLDLHNDRLKNNIETEYEKKFASKGFPIYMLNVYK